MLDIIQTIPSIIGNVWYQVSWDATATAISQTWPIDGIGYIDCYGRCYEIKSLEDLDAACLSIASCSDFDIEGA